MRVMGYVRVSTEGQAAEDKFGIDAQKEQIAEWVRANGHEFVYNAAGECFIEETKSGAKERERLDEIVYPYDDAVTNPPVEAIVVAKSDRVARDIELYYYYKHMMRRKNIQLISVSEDFGAMSAFSSILETFTALMAEQERHLIASRMSGGRAVKSAKGGYAGGKAPMGYKVQDGQLVINEDEAKVVRFIFEQKRNGASMRSVVGMLNDNGYKTRNGKEFVISTVQSIWNNERTYRGEYKYGDGDWVKGQHEPILVD